MTHTFDENGWQTGEIVAGEPLRYHRKLHTSVARGNRNWLQLRDVTEHVALWFDDQYLGEVDAGFLPRVFELRAFSPESLVSAEPLHPVRVALPTAELLNTGDVRIARHKVLCTEATNDRGVLSVGVEFDSLTSCDIFVQTVVRSLSDGEVVAEHHQSRSLAGGRNRLRWTVGIDTPLCWVEHTSDPHRYEVTTTVTVAGGPGLSDSATVTTGIRTVADKPPPPLATLSVDDETENRLRRLTGRNAYVRFAEILPFGAYDLADELGIPVCQRLPASTDAIRQAIDLLAHHPSIVAWSTPARRWRDWRPVPDQIQRIVDRGDGTRPLLRE